jgi:hypothetical protein
MVARLRAPLLCLVLFRPGVALGQPATTPSGSSDGSSSEQAPGAPVDASPLPSDAPAQETPEATEAQVAFQDGLALLRREDWALAEAKFRRSLELVPRESALYDLALVVVKQGRFRQSLQILERLQATAHAGRDPGSFRYAESLMAHVLSHLTRLRLVVAPSNASIVIDGELVSQTGAARSVALDPGRHQLGISAPGFTATRRELVAKAGTEISQQISLEPLPRNAAPSVAPSRVAADHPAERSSPSYVGPWLTMGVGGALLVGSVVTGILAIHKDSEFKDHCPTLERCDPRLEETRDDAARFARITNVLVVTGAVVMAGGVSWHLLTPPAPSTASRGLLLTVSGAY